MEDIWGSGPSDIYTVGPHETILHTADHGSTWVTLHHDDKSNVGLRAVWGSGPDDVYVAGIGAVLRSTNRGVTWESLPAAPPNVYLLGGAGANAVYLVGGEQATYSFLTTDHGATFSASPTRSHGFSFRGFAVSSTDDLYLVGDAGSILHGR
jgi:photosystem II stability/assembly factor-like uncharacterized protein